MPDYLLQLEPRVTGLRMGVAGSVLHGSNDPEVARLVDDAIRVLAEIGMERVEVELTGLSDARWTLILGTLEIASIAEELAPPEPKEDRYARYMQVRSRGSRDRLLRYGHSIQAAVTHQYAELFQQVDVIVLPTVPIPAPRFSDDRSPWQLPEEPFAEVAPRYTRIFNLIPCAAITVPCGFTAKGLPVGLQIVGRPFEAGVRRGACVRTGDTVAPQAPSRVVRGGGRAALVGTR